MPYGTTFQVCRAVYAGNTTYIIQHYEIFGLSMLYKNNLLGKRASREKVLGGGVLLKEQRT